MATKKVSDSKPTSATRTTKSTKAGAAKTSGEKSKGVATKRNTTTGPAATTQKTTPKKSNGGSGKHSAISETQRDALIAEAAYYIAEHRGFSQGDPTNDWLLAEKQIEKMLSQRKRA